MGDTHMTAARSRSNTEFDPRPQEDIYTMKRDSKPHVLDLHSSSRHMRSRSSSSSLDYAQSTTGSTYSTTILNSLLEVFPEPAFIAPAAATQIVTNNHGSFLDGQTVVSAGAPTIPVTTPALRLLNQFLDYLLYSFLATAKATTLPALRPAVIAVLKKKLAREAISGADEELQSYLGGVEGDQAYQHEQHESVSGEWDLELTWKRIRMRCMVYSSLGDLEEDDEAIYTPRDCIQSAAGSQQYNNHGVHGVLSPAVAIWLTAILEFMGEQTLLIAGHATIVRYSALLAAASAVESMPGRPPVPERPMVEELDAEKVAFNPSLGRLWRQWRKQLRGTGLSMSFTPETMNHWSSRPSTSKSLIGFEGSDATVPYSPVATYSDILGDGPGLDLGISHSPRKLLHLEKNIPELMDDTLVEGRYDEETDVKNPLTPVWETGSNMGGPAQSEITEFEDDSTDIGSWLAKYDDGRRPRSMIMFPWAISSQLEADSMPSKRPHSLPALDAPLEILDAEVMEDPFLSEDILIDSSIDLSLDIHRPEDARTKIDKLMDRINMITSEQAEFQKHLAAEEEFHSQVLASPETTRAPDRGLTVVTSIADETDFESDGPGEMEEVISIARASNYVKAISPKEIQCITLVPSAGRSKRRVKGKSSKTSLKDCSGTCNGKASTGPLAPVAEACQNREKSKPSVEHPISDFREVIDTALVSSDDEIAPNTAHGLKSLTQRTSSRLSPVPIAPISLSSHSKNISSSSSTRQEFLESRKNSYSSSIQNAPSTTSTTSDRSGKMRMRTSSGGADELRPSSSMSRIVPRPIHTSSSMTSQNSYGLKSFVSWPGDGSKRNDTDDTSSLRSERLLHRIKTRDEKERSFEELIQSGGTIVCTLTPDEIRGIEIPEPSPAYKAGDLAEYIRMATPDGSETPRPSSKAKSVHTKVPASLARDARMDDIAPSRDLALFLRSTGPPQGVMNSPRATTSHSTKSTQSPRATTSHSAKSSQLPRAMTSHSAKSIQSKASRFMGTGSPINSSPTAHFPPASPTITVPSVMTLQRMDTRPSTTQSTNKKRFVAREASGSTGDCTSALADFFRSTLPPNEGEAVVQHRIPRSVAPFRTTMDSAQFDMVNDVRPLCDESTTATDSYQSSMTSSTGLLNSAARRNDEFTSAKQSTRNPTPVRDFPIRNRRRVRDPYAIYDDDLDMEDDMDLVSRPVKEEESLADFLRSAPPSTHHITKVEELNANKKGPKKNSAANLITRFSRAPSRKNSISSPVSLDRSPTYRPSPIQRSETIDFGGFSTETQVQPTRAEFGNRPRLNSARGASRGMDFDAIDVTGTTNQRPQTRHKPIGEARSARVTQSSGMDELAAFLRESAPPSMGPVPDRKLETREKEENPVSGVSRFKSMAFRSKGKRKEVSGLV